jgi:hypothetical protein
MNTSKDDFLLPPRPGEIKKPLQGENKEVPIIIYINKQPVQLSRIEALGIIAQITQILLYLEPDTKETGKKDGAGD